MFCETNAKPDLGLLVSVDSHKMVLLRSTCHLGFVGVGNVELQLVVEKGFTRESRLIKLNTSLFLSIVSGCVLFEWTKGREVASSILGV